MQPVVRAVMRVIHTYMYTCIHIYIYISVFSGRIIWAHQCLPKTELTETLYMYFCTVLEMLILLQMPEMATDIRLHQRIKALIHHYIMCIIFK